MDNIEHLRKATRGLHKELESTGFAPKILDQTISKNELIAFWAAHHEVLWNLGQSTQSPYLNNLPEAVRLLRSDLEALGYATSPSTATMEWEAGEALGAAYVVLGSQMGAKLLQKKLGDQHKGLQTSYYQQLLGEESKNLFKGLMEEVKETTNIEPVVSGAQKTFQLFIVSTKRNMELSFEEE